MRPSILLLFAISLSGAHASWFGSDSPQYTSWSTPELQAWLTEHNIPVPSAPSQAELRDLVKSHWNSYSAWTTDQYASAQKAFSGLRDSTFDAWDESRLREFLLEQGVVAPSGPREQLVLLAKQKYAAYTNAASSISAAASTAAYGDSVHQATQSVSSIAVQATADVSRALDDSKDYVYSTWDDNRLRTFLEEKGVIKTKSEKKRDELLKLMRDAYAGATDPIWNAWSDSYLHEWLLAHGVIKSDYQKHRDLLTSKMSSYYYTLSDTAFSTWSDSDLKSWLVSHDIVKSDAQLQRDRLLRLVADNYAHASDTVWGAWSDSDMRSWLIEHGYLRSDEQVARDELIKKINAHYSSAASSASEYLVWPDARLRAYLRQHGVDESAVLKTDRPGLLQEVRVRWVQSQGRADAVLAKLREVVDRGVGKAEERLGRVLEVLGGAGGEAKEKGERAEEKIKEEL